MRWVQLRAVAQKTSRRGRERTRRSGRVARKSKDGGYSAERRMDASAERKPEQRIKVRLRAAYITCRSRLTPPLRFDVYQRSYRCWIFDSKSLNKIDCETKRTKKIAYSTRTYCTYSYTGRVLCMRRYSYVYPTRLRTKYQPAAKKRISRRDAMSSHWFVADFSRPFHPPVYSRRRKKKSESKESRRKYYGRYSAVSHFHPELFLSRRDVREKNPNVFIFSGFARMPFRRSDGNYRLSRVPPT